MSSTLVRTSIVLLSAALCGGTAQAQNASLDGRVNAITSAVPFLRISPDARSGGMGDIGIATPADASAQYWNIGKVPFAEKKYGIAATYTPWLKDLVPDISLIYVSGYGKFGKEDNQAISASLRYFNLGDINYTDYNAQSLGTGKPREFSFDLGYSRRLSPYLSTGIGFRYIHSAIANGLASAGTGTDYKPGNGLAADLGVFYTRTKEVDEIKGRTFSAGAVISNLGTKISYSSTRRDFLPMNLGLGVANTWKLDEYNKVTVGLDLNKLLVPTPQYKLDTAGNIIGYLPSEKTVVSGLFSSFGDAPGGFSEELKEVQVSLGSEYWYQNQFAVRAGYFYENKLKGDRKYFAAGLSARYNVLTIHASYLIPSNNGTVRNPLSNTFRFTLAFDTDNLRGNKTAEEATTE